MTTVESYPADLMEEVGHIVMSTVWVEDEAGEVIQFVPTFGGAAMSARTSRWGR